MQLFGLRSIYISDKYVAWHFPFSVDSPLDIFFTIYAPLPFPRTKTTVLPTKTAQAAKPLSACVYEKIQMSSGVRLSVCPCVRNSYLSKGVRLSVRV